ncbi:MAG: methionine ABC transporter permease [Zoogloea oleivorans]|jgi:D-methionine transport system permease protein|uniref:ABC transporter permease n=1 Tax=Zoogloea oleivorans TaxID=1552750 RepID=A0A6C2CM41_9RHOO|nr:methionine ABC transporter permease [Zoogloea oleivorans]MDY0038497.1 methionine ABC transporter permease [Zoogloea oleivorans]TYC54412.1 ABC transporter permease [Zoogloea oleivorans]
MLDTLIELLPEILKATGETLLMLAICLSAAILIGGALGLLVFLTSKGQSLERFRAFNLIANGVINVVRSFPFIILLVAISPFTRVIAGTSIGPLAASVPLSIAAIFYFARLIEQTLRDVPRGVIEAAEAMGASPLQIIRHVLLVEGRSGLILAVTVLAVSFLSYSAVAGVVGGGGIGDLAIRYGYYRFQTDVMLITIVLLVVLVQSIQFFGQWFARHVDKR